MPISSTLVDIYVNAWVKIFWVQIEAVTHMVLYVGFQSKA